MRLFANSSLSGRSLKQLFRPGRNDLIPGLIGTFMGRDALRLAAWGLRLQPSDRVLLPAYLCREVFKPFVGKALVDFYDVGPGLEVAPDEIERRLDATPIKAVLIIHYFGFLQPHSKRIKEICAARGAVLIEDCAHSLLSANSGETGDVAVYSFRKILPVPDGGGLKINSGTEARFEARYYPKACSNALSLAILLKSALNVRAGLITRSGIERQPAPRAPRSGPRTPPRFLPLSTMAANGLSNISRQEMTRRRRDDYQFWHNAVSRSSNFKPVFSELPPGVCPMAYPALVEARDAIKAQMIEKGVLLKTYWHLPDEVGEKFETSRDLARRVMTLPVYPELPEQHREVLLATLFPRKRRTNARWEPLQNRTSLT